MWGDTEDKEEKKLYRIGKGAAYSIGGGLGVWGMKLFYPHPDGSERLTAVLGPIGWILILYGITILTVIVMHKNMTLTVNRILFWLVIPACLYYIFVNNWHG